MKVPTPPHTHSCGHSREPLSVTDWLAHWPSRDLMATQDKEQTSQNSLDTVQSDSQS